MPEMHLRIGIENEMFLTETVPLAPRSVQKSHLITFANALVPLYNGKPGTAQLRAEFSHGPHPGHYSSHNDEHKWTVTTDEAIGDFSLESAEIEGYALEFVSPILDFCSGGTWREEVRDHWNKLLQFGKVYIDNDCATHVHVSPGVEKQWSLEQLKQVAQAVLYFEEAFKAIFAPSRREHDHTKFNKADNDKLDKLEFGECCELVQKCTDADHLAFLMQPPESNYPLADRHYAWNFVNTTKGEDRIGTIEFRCAPGAQTAEQCLIWVELGASFVRAAAQFGTQAILGKAYAPTVNGLKEFIHNARFEGMDDSGFWEIPFDSVFESGAPLRSDKEMRDVFAEKIKSLGR